MNIALRKEIHNYIFSNYFTAHETYGLNNSLFFIITSNNVTFNLFDFLICRSSNKYIGRPFLFFKTKSGKFIFLDLLKVTDPELKKNEHNLNYTIFTFLSFNQIVEKDNISEITVCSEGRGNPLAYCSENISYWSESLLNLYFICKKNKINFYVITEFGQKNVFFYEIIPNKNTYEFLFVEKKNFLHYSLLEKSNNIVSDYPIKTSNFDFFIDYIWNYNRLLPGVMASSFNNNIVSVYSKELIVYGEINLENLNVEQQAAFIYDFWYIELHTIAGLGIGLSHWRDSKLYFTLSSNLSVFTTQNLISILLNKNVTWLNYENIQIFIDSKFKHEKENSYFNKYYIGIFDTSDYMYWYFYNDISGSFNEYYFTFESCYLSRSRLPSLYDENENPENCFKFPKACYYYLGLNDLDPLIWISKPPILYDLRPIKKNFNKI